MPTPSAATRQTWVSREPWLSPQPDRTALRPSGAAVLVVDDDRGVLRLTARMLRLEGYTVLEAGSGVEALRVLESEPGIQLVVSDVMMPGMHGLELATKILERDECPQVVLMTGHGRGVHMRLIPMGSGYRYAGPGVWFDGMRQQAVLNWGRPDEVPCTLMQE